MKLGQASVYKGDRLLSENRTLLICGVVAWLIASAGTLIATGATKMTASPAALYLSTRCSVGFGFIILLVLSLGRILLRRVWSKNLGYILGAFIGLMCLGIGINMAGWCPDGDTTAPVLHGLSTDSGRDWAVASAMYEGRALPFPSNTGYPLLLVVVWSVFGKGILAPVLLSAVCMALAAMVCSAVAVNLLPHLTGRKVAVCAAGMFALVPNILWHGTLLMKEGVVCLAFGLCVLTLSQAWRGKITMCGIASGASGALALMVVRSPVGWFLMLGALMAALHIFFSRKSGRWGAGFNGALFMILLSGVTVVGGERFRGTHDASFKYIVTDLSEGNEYLQINMFGYKSVQSYRELIGDYYTTPLYERVGKLPLMATAQYFPPFPWNFNRDRMISHFVPWAHLPLWYIVGGIVLAYYVLCVGRRSRAAGLMTWSLWVLLVWCGIAIASAGSVARYWLPLLPAMLPLGVQAAYCVRRKIVPVRVSVCYGVAYAALVITGLIVSYFYLKP